VEKQSFRDFERFSRGANQLAGSTIDSVWLENWSLINAHQVGDHTFQLRANDENYGIDITLESEKPPVLQGNKGLSQKGSKRGNASYYYSLTRLKTSGKLIVDGDTVSINGTSWMDREWSTSMLEENQAGWDWFSLQLDNDQELMYYQLRDTSQVAGPTSSGSLVSPLGEKSALKRDDVMLKVLEKWTSPESGITYPSGWQLTVPSYQIDLTVTPVLDNQELKAAVIYWEGAVKVEGTWNGEKVSGKGYVELTGY
jgi:predicted secreted hydrolase